MNASAKLATIVMVTPLPWPTDARVRSIPATFMDGSNEPKIPNKAPEIAAIHPREAITRLMMVKPVIRLKIATITPQMQTREIVTKILVPAFTSDRL